MTASLVITLQLLVAINIVYSQNPVKECTDYEECMNADIEKGKIICSGDSSCEEAQSLKALTNVFCSGFRSCRKAVDLQTTKPVGRLTCSGYDSCSDASLLSTTMFCNGEHSCSQSVTSSDISLPTKKAYCRGRASCFQRNIDSSGPLECTGEASCDATTINAGGRVSCQSNRACSYSTITTPSIVDCDGYRACYGATISGAKEVRLYGVASGDFISITDVGRVEAYSGFTLSQAIIDSGSLSKMDVELFGVSLDIYHESTFVLCRSGAECLLVCKDNGCYGLQYHCDIGATCSMRPKQCMENNITVVNGRDCPDIFHGPISSTLINKKERETNKRKERETDSTSDTHLKTESDTETFKLCNEESVCSEKKIENNQDGIICGGKLSCKSSGLFVTKKDASIGCTGAFSCDSTRIDASNLLYCYGEESCKSSSVQIQGNVECKGTSSCIDLTLYIAQSKLGSFLECGSYKSCYNVAMKTSSKPFYDVECNGYKSCMISQFDAENSIFCEGCQSCQESTLISESNIQCLGYEACSKATLVIKDYIFLKGSYAGVASDITYGNVKRGADHSDSPIKAEGFKSLNKAIIDSVGSTAIMVHLLGHLSGYDATIFCRDGSECTVVCHTTGCTQLDYICEKGAICNVRPIGCNGTVTNSEGIGCPNIQTNVNSNDIEKILKQKKIQRENDEELNQLIKNNDDDDDEYINNNNIDNYKELNVLIGDKKEMMSLTNIQSSLFSIISILSVIAFVYFYLCYKPKYIEYQPLQ